MRNDIISVMYEVTTLEGKQKQFWTAVFVLFIVAFSVICLQYMNMNYDPLARYPYRDETSRALIRKYLNQEEIEYIIEYSIPPNMFIAYIQEEGFSIYHAAEYKQLSISQWDESPANIVKMVEETRNIMSVDQLEIYLLDNNYTYDDIHAWISDPDEEAATLVTYAFNPDTWLDAFHTVSTRAPQLTVISGIPTGNDMPVEIHESVNTALNTLCSGMRTSLSSTRACAGLMVQEGYVSHRDQTLRYSSALQKGQNPLLKTAEKPGHDEHQLGLAVDFMVDGVENAYFDKTIQSQWLEENAWKYGFVQTWNRDDVIMTYHDAEPWHYRYIGTDLARTIHESGLTFARYKARIRE